MKSTFLKGSGICMVSAILLSMLWCSCKKVETKQDTQAAAVKTMSGRVTINMEDVYAALPVHTMYNFRKELSFYPERADWFYTSEYLQVRIPTTKSDNDFVYAIKRYDKPEVTSVFVVHFTPDADNTEAAFSGEQRWLNLQNNKVYLLRYKRNKVVAHAAPSAPVAPVGWEKLIMAQGAFFINAAGKMELGDPSSYSGNVVPMSDDEGDGGANLPPSDRDILNDQYGANNISQDPETGALIINVPIGPSPVIDDGEPGSDYSDQGNGLDWGWAPQPGGGGSVKPKFDPPIVEPEMPLAVNGHNLHQAGLNGSSIAAHWYDPTSPAVAIVASVLTPSTTQIAWLSQHEDMAIRIRDYLLTFVPGLTRNQKKEIAREHLIRMMEDPAYFTFVNNYNQNNTGMWWMNEDWVNDLSHFELTPNSGLGTGLKATWRTLTALEKQLSKVYPVQAFIIFTRFGTAQDIAKETTLPYKTNGKQDAFRHAFFQAICVRDMLPRFTPVYISRAQIVLLFATAHEDEVPTALALERQMDLFNNSVGITYGESISIFSLDNTVKNSILDKVTNGELKYLTPLDTAVSHPYDDNGDHIQDCSTCLNGMISTTQLKPTNQ